MCIRDSSSNVYYVDKLHLDPCRQPPPLFSPLLDNRSSGSNSSTQRMPSRVQRHPPRMNEANQNHRSFNHPRPYSFTQHGSRNTPWPPAGPEYPVTFEKRIVPGSMAVQYHRGASRISCVQTANRAQRTLVFVNSKFKKQHCGVST